MATPEGRELSSSKKCHLKEHEESEEYFRRFMKIASKSDEYKRKEADYEEKMRMDLNPNTVMLLLRQENDRIDDQLRKKREEVTKRIETCRIKQQELKKKDCELQRRIESYRQSLEESQVFRYRAMQRTAADRKVIQQHEAKETELKKELHFLEQQNNALQKSVNRELHLKCFLSSTYTAAPLGYFDQNMPMEEAVMVRYRSLAQNQLLLQKEYQALNDKVFEAETELAELKDLTEREIMVCYSKIAQLVKKQEFLINGNIVDDEKIGKHLQLYRQKHKELYLVLDSINNISHACKTSVNKLNPAESLKPAFAKLKQIEDFITHHQAVVHHAKAATRNEAKKIMQLSNDDLLCSTSLPVIATATAAASHSHQ